MGYNNVREQNNPQPSLLPYIQRCGVSYCSLEVVQTVVEHYIEGVGKDKLQYIFHVWIRQFNVNIP